MHNNALLVISPLESGLLTPSACADMALALKRHGVTRADLTTFPRFAYASRTASHKGWAPADISTVAHTLIHTVLGPILGHATLQEMSFHARLSPTLSSLATVGALFAHAATPINPYMDRTDGNDLGLILYLAVHARNDSGAPYDTMLFPTLSARARKALRGLLEAAPAQYLDGYGPLIDLHAQRQAIQRSSRSAQTKGAPQHLLN